MKKQTLSLLEELEKIGKNNDTKHIIENRANNVISSAIHLLEVIDRNYSPEYAEILEKKLLISIKNRDQAKFSKTLNKIIEGNNNEKS